ncbi:hypothetical protein HNP33_000915 [Comamonas odontotermitis]|uniref:PKD/Chitinase domain-containing protein n=1 Tax=Comamonas odontotermitis TaxID=379895 RepID=A0ABR6RCH9_9BURK|nr:PKD domain-containing protein [Comamonas odontotermitis]MBB6576865.1 hypothetical protein [Comamonas odontotermitis]
MRLFTKSITAALISCAFSAGWAANTITPQNGNWIITNEMTGKPGRGMGIDVQDGIFLMQLYNYNQDGSATFHMATGPVVDNKVVAPLKQYKDGPSFGSAPKNGTEAANAGNVEIEFTSRTTATIKLPGEKIKRMQRFNYESMPEAQWSDTAYSERWAMVEFDENDKPVKTYFADIGLGSQLALNPDMDPGWPYAKSNKFTVRRFDIATPKQYGFMECNYTGANHLFACVGEELNSSGTTLTRQPTTLTMERSLDELHGTITVGTGGTKHRVLGARVEKVAYTIKDNKLVIDQLFRRNSLPEAGTWIVTKEVTGQAGRGISLDVQKPTNAKHTLFMPIYNYTNTGKATFHIGLQVHSPSTIPTPDTPSIRLLQYRDGRYLGGPPSNAVEDGYAGISEVTFATSATGLVQFPQEDPLRMQRYYFGVNVESVDSLVGTWALVPHAGAAKYRILNLVKTGEGVVEDKEAGYTCFSNYWLEFRFACEPKTLTGDQQRIRIGTGFYGAARAILGDGGPLPDTSPELTIMRIADGKGNLVQAGPLYLDPSIDDGTSGSDDDSEQPAPKPNKPPVAAIAEVTNAVHGTTVNLDGSGSSDADGNPITYKWALVSAPQGSTAYLSSSTSAKPSFLADKVGQYVIVLVVNDGKDNSQAAQTTINVKAINNILLYSIGSTGTDDTTENLVTWPYTATPTSTVSCEGNCGTTYKVAGYKLVANGTNYTIADLKTENLTPDSPVKATFDGLRDGQVVTAGQPLAFALRSTYTNGETVKLQYSFTIKETGQKFSYLTTFKSN